MEPEVLEQPSHLENQVIQAQENERKSPNENKEINNGAKQSRVIRKPGRPSMRGRGRFNVHDSGHHLNYQKDEDFQVLKQKGQSRTINSNEESNMESFIRIIDYLKKIDCDEASLHNKMNPYNLLTSTCFWYIVSAEYFSFDFFNNRNPNDAAIDILRRAQKIFVTMPQRIVKPIRIHGILDFETPQLLERSRPITEKLTSLIKPSMQFNVDGIEKASYVTTISEDDVFRSSTRAIIFNYLKKKLQNNQKWSSSINQYLQCDIELPSKAIEYLATNPDAQQKQLINPTGSQILYRQKRKVNPQSIKKTKETIQKKKKGKPIKNRKKKIGSSKDKKDDIFHESEEDKNDQNDEDMENQDNIEYNTSKKQQMDIQNQIQGSQVKSSSKHDHDSGKLQIVANQDHIIGQKSVQQNDANVEHESNKIKEQQSEQNNRDYQIASQEKQKHEQDINNEQEQVKDQQNILKMQEQHIKDEQDEDQQQQGQQNIQDMKNSNRYKFYTKKYTNDDVLLNSIMHLPLDNVISLLQASLQPIQLPPITKQPLSLPKNDPLDLVYQIHPEQEKFLQYMKNRQQKLYLQKLQNGDRFEEKQRQTQFQDAKCQVCTDGDYTEDNLIVFCSMCNISVHQKCVGLNKVPSENWICEVCQAFGPAGCNVPCPLCNIKGGALKRTSIHINQPLFRQTNPGYHQYSKTCPFIKQKEEYTKQPIINSSGEPEPYYDYFTKSTYTSDQPVCNFVWVHYVCAIWVPQCYFEEKNGIINIKGVQNIDKKRFKQKCLVCQQVKAGASVKCENYSCVKYYHAQCARKHRIYMQQLNLDKLRYLIFCQAHEPLKVKRKIDVKKKKNRDQIIKFCRGIEKYVQTYKIAPLNFKLMKVINNMEFNRQEKMNEGKGGNLKDQKQNQDKVIVKIERNTDEDFIKSVIEGLGKYNQIIVNLVKLGDNRYKVEQVAKPSKRDMRKSLNRVQQFWKNFKNGQPADINLRRFNNIMRQNFFLKQKIENFINYGDIEQPKPQTMIKKPNLQSRKGVVGRRPKIAKQTIIQQQGGIFCVCRKPYCGQTDMFQCQVCTEWYHHQCIGFIGSEEDAQSLDFHCMKCMKYESQQKKIERLNRCAKFFSEDSLFLNYRPPTPSLQSDEKDEIQRAESYKNQSENQPKNSQVNNEKNESENEVSQMAQKSEKIQKSTGKTKILAILNKPFVIEGPHIRQQDTQFFENKKKLLQIQKNINKQQSNINRKNSQINQQQLKPSLAHLAPNFIQMQSISFKGQFIDQQKQKLQLKQQIVINQKIEVQNMEEQEIHQQKNHNEMEQQGLNQQNN